MRKGRDGSNKPFKRFKERPSKFPVPLQLFPCRYPAKQGKQGWGQTSAARAVKSNRSKSPLGEAGAGNQRSGA